MPTRIDSVQRLPELLGCVLSSIQRCLSSLWTSFDPFFELLAPHARMMDIRCRVKGEIATGLFVGAVHFAQATLFFAGDSGHLRFVGIESGQRFFGRAVAGNLMKMTN